MAADKALELLGIVRNTKDSASRDGECDEVINLRHKDGSWRPVGVLRNVSGYESLETFGYERLFIHTNEYRHLFGVRNGDLYWIGDIDDNSTITPFVAGGGGAYSQPQLIKENVSLNMRICQTGHLFVVIDDSLSYYMFRTHENKYDKVITDYNNEINGRLLPYGNVELKVDLECDDTGRPFIFSSYIEDSGILGLHVDKAAEVMTDVIYKTQKDIAALNRFWGAFLVCTAAELYDGNYILMSQPALMLAPNVKSLDKYQNANLPYLRGNSRTSISSVWEKYDSVNPDYCEAMFNYFAEDGIQSGIITTSDICNDVREGHLYYSLRPDSEPDGVNSYVMPISLNKTDYPYDKELITDSNFKAEAIDRYLQLVYGYSDIPSTTLDSFPVALNIKNEVPFYATSYGNTIECMHFANKIKYRITSNIPAEYRDVIKNISIFITPQAQTSSLLHNVKRLSSRLIYDYRTPNNIVKELMREPMFYKIGEIKTSDFREGNVGKWVDLPIEEGVLTNLLSQPRLVVDSMDRDSYNAKVAFPYNNRLHIADYIEEKFHGWLIDHFFYNEGVGQFEEGSVGVVANSSRQTIGWVKVTISEDGIQKTVTRDIAVPASRSGQTVAVSQNKNIRYLNPMLSYPDRNAVSMEIFIRTDMTIPGANNTFHETYTLKPHDFYNFAYYITDDLKPIDTHLTKTEAWQAPPSETNASEAYHNRLKVSLTNNPLYFPYETTYSVGNGKILGMAANELVLATGQIGDAPLYVFCSDGTYGFFVDSSGQLTYSFSRILSEYVCNNAGGIFNIHGGVMFPTDKGYVLLNGLQTKDVTDKIEGRLWDSAEISEVGQVANHTRLVSLADKITGEDFTEFIKGCVGGYNFADKEIWLTNKAKGYSYIIDEDGLYSKRTDCGVQLVNDFPRTYLLDVNQSGGVKVSNLRNLLDEEKGVRQTLFLTRAVKDGTQEFKQTERLIMRGEFHLPTSAEYNVRLIDLTQPRSIAARPLLAKAPENIIDVHEGTAITPNVIAPQMIYQGWIAVCDTESLLEVKDPNNNYIDLSDNDETFSAVKELFSVGYLIDPTLGWRSLTPSDADSVQYRISPDTDMSSSYAVRLKFGNNRPYLIKTQHNLSVVLYCFDGLEISCDDFADLINGNNIKGVCLRIHDGSTYENRGLYIFNSNLQSQDQISISDKGNYRSAYLYYDRTQTPNVAVKDVREWRIETLPSAAVNCLDFIQNEVVNNASGDILPVIYDNMVTVAVGNNTLYLDEERTQYVTFSATLAQTSADIYDTIRNNYNKGVYGTVAFNIINRYNLPRNSYVRLIDTNGTTVKVIYYTGTGTVTWAQLNAYANAQIVDGNTTLQLAAGEIYHIIIGFYDSNNVYCSVNEVMKYTGPTGTMTLFAIYTDITAPTHSPKFQQLTAADYLAAYHLYVRAGDYLSVRYYSSSTGSVVTANIWIDTDELIDGATFVTNIENGEYSPWQPVDKLAGLYLFGSYDNRKWQLLGAREMDGDFRDLGLIAYRVDCKYFKLLFVGQLKDRSSIEYIEHIVSDRVFRKKRR